MTSVDSHYNSMCGSPHGAGPPSHLSTRVHLSLTLPSLSLRGHPFMMSTRRGRGSGSGERMWAGEGSQAPCERLHRKLKLESTDVILSSSHAKKLASF